MAKVFKPGETPTYERIMVYADPKSGKSRFVTSLPEEWGDIVYVAADNNSESLLSTLPKYRKRIHVIKPEFKEGPSSKVNPVAEAYNIANMDWKKLVPSMGVLVWDTISATADQFLNHIADSGQFSEKHISIDTGTGGMMAIPMEGDYGAAQRSISRLIDILAVKPYHVIITAWSVLGTKKDGTILGGGPATVGSATVTKLPGIFNPVIYLKTKNSPAVGSAPAKTLYLAHTVPQGHYTAGIREAHDGGNHLARVELQPDPGHWFRTYEEEYR